MGTGGVHCVIRSGHTRDEDRPIRPIQYFALAFRNGRAFERGLQPSSVRGGGGRVTHAIPITIDIPAHDEFGRATLVVHRDHIVPIIVANIAPVVGIPHQKANASPHGDRSFRYPCFQPRSSVNKSLVLEDGSIVAQDLEGASVQMCWARVQSPPQALHWRFDHQLALGFEYYFRSSDGLRAYHILDVPRAHQVIRIGILPILPHGTLPFRKPPEFLPGTLRRRRARQILGRRGRRRHGQAQRRPRRRRRSDVAAPELDEGGRQSTVGVLVPRREGQGGRDIPEHALGVAVA
mmetsp:Transcript_20827/g.35770  ORF Transcript_20827/g.35770 Transcript_20827/m.35770 type:complete len:292 (-) Transcript_20827:592-1467(-)